MPILDLTLFDDMEFKLIHLTAVMCWPSEKESEHRACYILREYLALAASEYTKIISGEQQRAVEASIYIGQWLGESIIPFGGWTALAHATIGDSQKRSPVKDVQSRMGQGVVVGWILDDMVRMNDGSFIGAARRWLEQVPEIKKMLKIPPAPKENFSYQNANKIQNDLWKKLRDSAHLWAAFIKSKSYLNSKPHRYLPLDRFEPYENSARIANGLAGFLELSTMYLNEGRKLTPPSGPNSDKSIVRQETSWEIIF